MLMFLESVLAVMAVIVYLSLDKFIRIHFHFNIMDHDIWWNLMKAILGLSTTTNKQQTTKNKGLRN